MKGQKILTSLLANIPHIQQKRTQTHIHTHARARIHARPHRIKISLQKKAEKLLRTSTHIYVLARSVPTHTHTLTFTRTYTHTHIYTLRHRHTHDTSMMSHHTRGHDDTQLIHMHIWICMWYARTCTWHHAANVIMLMSAWWHHVDVIVTLYLCQHCIISSAHRACVRWRQHDVIDSPGRRDWCDHALLSPAQWAWLTGHVT